MVGSARSEPRCSSRTANIRRQDPPWTGQCARRGS